MIDKSLVKSEVVKVRLKESEKEMIFKEAERRDITVSELVREAVMNYIEAAGWE